MKLIEQIRLNDGRGFDIADNTTEDVYMALECETSEKDCDDNCDKFLYWLAANLEIVKSVPQEYGTLMICDVYGLVEQHYEAFVAFTKESNRLPHIMDFENKDANMSVALKTINNMICGNYAEEDYSYFMELLKKDLQIENKIPLDEQIASAERECDTENAGKSDLKDKNKSGITYMIERD